MWLSLSVVMACCYQPFICMKKELARVRFVGIHTGHLGFYTDYLDGEVEQLIETLRKDRGDKISYPLLNVRANLG